MARKRQTRKTDWPDPAGVREVRRWRQELVSKAGGTVEGLAAYLQRRAEGCTSQRSQATRNTKKDRAA